MDTSENASEMEERFLGAVHVHVEDRSKNSFCSCLRLPFVLLHACLFLPFLRLIQRPFARPPRGHLLSPHLSRTSPALNAPTFVCCSDDGFVNFHLSWEDDDQESVVEVMKKLDKSRAPKVVGVSIIYEVLVKIMYGIANNVVVNLSLFRLVADRKVPTILLPFQSVLRSSYSIQARRVEDIVGITSLSVIDESGWCGFSDPPETKLRCDIIWPRSLTPTVSSCSPVKGLCHLSRVSMADLGSDLGHVDADEILPLKTLVYNRNVILYLHGGAYVLCNTRSHRSLIYSVCRRTETVVFAPNFRRPPEFDLKVTLDDAMQSYLFLVNELDVAPKRITVMGESAGGALTLSLLQQLNKLQRQLNLSSAASAIPICLLPGNSVLVSPWVDLSADEKSSESFLTNNNADSDMISAEVVKRFANRIARGRSYFDPTVSPIYGDLTNLPPMLLLVGERELLRDQVIKLAKLAKSVDERNSVTLQIYHDMCHAFPLFQFCHPLAAQSLVEICSFMEANTHTRADEAV